MASNLNDEAKWVLTEAAKARGVALEVEDFSDHALYTASSGGYENWVRLLVEEGKADVNQATTDHGQTPLYVAAFKGHVGIARLLVEEGKADVNHEAYDGRTPLTVAATAGHTQVAEVIIEKGYIDLDEVVLLTLSVFIWPEPD